MNQNKQKSFAMGIGVGSSSILAVFVVLCLTTFAILSLVSAQADLRLSQKSAAAVSLYYQADVKGQTLIEELYNLSGDSLEELAANSKNLEYITSSQKQDSTILVHFSIPMNDVSSLNGEATLFPAHGENIVNLRSYRVEVTAMPSDEANMEIWDGKFPS